MEVTPAWHFRLPRRSSFDGLTRVRNGVVHRLLHIDERPVVVRIAQLSSGNVLFGATDLRAIDHMRRALWVDADLKPFHDRFRHDEWIGAAVRADPSVRPAGRPDAFEALLAAITEQLIEFERATAIQRRIHARYGQAHRLDATLRLTSAATAVTLAQASTARLESFDLVTKRAVTLVRAAREVAARRVELDTRDPAAQERGWERLRRIPGIGSWTVEMTALIGQQRIDQIPAGDLGFIKLAGWMQSGGDPRARGSEDEVRALFERFGPYKGLAGAYALRGAGMLKSPLLN